ncbi:serine O-acetyltransferase [Paraburkholderia caledonica]|uniref:Serine acetyltransferase n=1 Tax=Paraburkholderia caledonica TaxID=134536 RepID=A0AB73I7X1_9BURK|nr:serine O-acetyltransferase [Paraburkholderia caledonica]
MFTRLREDIATIRERDPAARSAWEVLTCYPGLHALVLHRLAHACWQARRRWLARFVSQMARFMTGIEIHPGATVGRRVFIDHGMGVVIGETAQIGDDCTIYQGVTLGGTSLTRGAKRHPTLERGVIVGAGAKVLGGFTIGADAKIGSNAVVTKPVPAGGTAVGNPARVIVPAAASTAAAAAAASVVAKAAASAGSNGVDSAAVHAAVNAAVNAPIDGVASAALDPATNAPASANDTTRESGKLAVERSGFCAYGITPNADDPVSLAIHGLIDHAATQAKRIDEIVMALEHLGTSLEGLQGADAALLDLRRLSAAIAGKLDGAVVGR